ncbi:hypothetical protein EXIGLDRAFT_706712 [Exidia glandulosa HHB12029]|uniref:AA1-like domain-containing protein n=1 Tax=Exidia glandulosa HHB12029 TaxID=1314781 RepID=A0A165B1H1_EXIGL|nr:hypothetical protein EXIGLDRAFT_706712 [Exidia glandulosa HHB12029]
MPSIRSASLFLSFLLPFSAALSIPTRRDSVTCSSSTAVEISDFHTYDNNTSLGLRHEVSFKFAVVDEDAGKLLSGSCYQNYDFDDMVACTPDDSESLRSTGTPYFRYTSEGELRLLVDSLCSDASATSHAVPAVSFSGNIPQACDSDAHTGGRACTQKTAVRLQMSQ